MGNECSGCQCVQSKKIDGELPENQNQNTIIPNQVEYSNKNGQSSQKDLKLNQVDQSQAKQYKIENSFHENLTTNNNDLSNSKSNNFVERKEPLKINNEEITNLLKTLQKLGDNTHDPCYFYEARQEIYQGKIIQGVRQGYGSCYSQLDGGYYEGFWDHDIQNGKGRKIDKEGNYYEGDFLNGQPHGFGIIKRKDGGSYEGNWINGKKHGKGKEFSPKGITYEGDFVEDRMHGKGKYIINDRYIYQGEFQADDIEGEGECQWMNGKKYIGQWKSNKMEGQGKFTWADNKEYKGEFKDDKFHGVGTFTWPNGIKYHGEWENGEMNGQGELTTEKGEVFRGTWKNGQTVTINKME